MIWENKSLSVEFSARYYIAYNWINSNRTSIKSSKLKKKHSTIILHLYILLSYLETFLHTTLSGQDLGI